MKCPHVLSSIFFSLLIYSLKSHTAENNTGVFQQYKLSFLLIVDCIYRHTGSHIHKTHTI